MQRMQQAMNAYGQAAETVAPARQIVMLYDGALRRIKEARQAIERHAINDRYVAIGKAAAIIDALQSCLDHERGGAIATNLDRLYTYFGLRLQRINVDDDVAICDELIERLGELRASWAEIADARASPGAARPRTAVGEPGTAVTI